MAKRISTLGFKQDSLRAVYFHGGAPSVADEVEPFARPGDNPALKPPVPAVDAVKTRTARTKSSVPVISFNAAAGHIQDFGAILSAHFAEAASVAAGQAHADGLAVPARDAGKAVELRPDGTTVEIPDRAGWSPEDWKSTR